MSVASVSASLSVSYDMIKIQHAMRGMRASTDRQAHSHTLISCMLSLPAADWALAAVCLLAETASGQPLLSCSFPLWLAVNVVVGVLLSALIPQRGAWREQSHSRFTRSPTHTYIPHAYADLRGWLFCVCWTHTACLRVGCCCWGGLSHLPFRSKERQLVVEVGWSKHT